MDLLLLILIFVLGFFLLLIWVVSRPGCRFSVLETAVVLFVVYSCIAGLIVLVADYLAEPGLLFYAFAIVYSCIYWVWQILHRKKTGLRLQYRMVFALLAYTLAVLYITAFMREGGSNSRVQMELFHWMQAEERDTFHHFLMNIVMFIPYGLLTPYVVSGRYTGTVCCVSLGMALSAAIETGQLIFRSGTCDVDDLIANSFGALIGALVVAGWRTVMQNKQQTGKRRGNDVL